MRFAHEEYKASRHFISPSGVRAECSDCHVGMGIRKALVLKQLIQDLFVEFRRPIRDKADWEQRKALLAEKARKRLGCGQGCGGCHDSDLMKPSNERGRIAHERIKKEGMGCMECHKNIAHAEAD